MNSMEKGAFDPEHVQAMNEALAKASAKLKDSQADVLIELLASKIISVAGTGERDPDRLCDDALIGMGIFE
jgi:hypothetical protein